MAKTLTINDALNIAALRFPRILTDSMGARFADEVLSEMWMRYPWRESLADLPPFHLVYGQSDYGPPIYAVPSDFASIHDLWIRDSNGTPYPLVDKDTMKVVLSIGIPDTISYEPEVSSFRVGPRPNISAPDYWIEGKYKKTITAVTNSTLTSYAFPFDDKYFGVFRQGLVWKYKNDILGDPSAVNDYQLFRTMLDDMAMKEGIDIGKRFMVPDEGLMLGGM